jgi:pyruvate dehydrogenase E1 component alpha subunit
VSTGNCKPPKLGEVFMANRYFGIFDPLAGKTLEIMQRDGTVDEALRPTDLTDEKMLELYKEMALLREVDDMAVRMQREGRMGTYAPVRGQEACQASAAALEPGDWIVPSYREMGAMYFHSIPFEMTYRYWMGDEGGSAWPRSKCATPISIPVGSQPLHAVGLAWAMKLRGEKSAVIAYFGDGASSEGEVHEAMNFAGVYKLPVIFFCQNNQFAISVPRRSQTASATIAQKATAYGFEGIQIYGNDLMAVWGSVKEALASARAGEGPKLIEASTYRLGAHTTADDPTKYRTDEEVEKQRPYDPMTRLNLYLTAKNLWSPDRDEAMWAGARTKAEKIALDAEQACASPKISDIFDYTFETLPPDLQKQRESCLRSRQGGGD